MMEWHNEMQDYVPTQEEDNAIRLTAGLYAYKFMCWHLGYSTHIRELVMDEFGMTEEEFEQQVEAAVEQQYHPHWVNSDLYPHPEEDVVNPADTLEEKAACVDADIAEIRTRYNNGTLGLLLKYSNGFNPPIENDVGNDAELYIPFPPNQDYIFNIHLSNYLNSDIGSKYSLPACLFDSVAFFSMKASHALYNQLPAFHTSATCHTREDRINDLIPIEIDRSVISERPGPQTIWDLANIDQFGPLFNGIIALYAAGTNLLEPPQGNLLNSSAYRHTNVNKSLTPDDNAMIERIGLARFREYDRHCREQLRMIGGFRAYLRRYRGVRMVMPGDMIDDFSMIIHPHFFNKKARQAFQAGVLGALNEVWYTVKDMFMNAVNGILQRTAAYLVQVGIVRQYLLSEEYADSTLHRDGRSAYGICNFILSCKFHLTHHDRRHLHLPNHDEERGLSFITQTLATHNLQEVQAVAMDYSNITGHSRLIQMKIPIPSIGSFHVSIGPASRPLLGAIFTVNEEYYRPTLYPHRFRFANPMN